MSPLLTLLSWRTFSCEKLGIFYTSRKVHLWEKGGVSSFVFQIIISYLGSPTLSAGVHLQSPDNLNTELQEDQTVQNTKSHSAAPVQIMIFFTLNVSQ